MRHLHKITICGQTRGSLRRRGRLEQGSRPSGSTSFRRTEQRPQLRLFSAAPAIVFERLDGLRGRGGVDEAKHGRPGQDAQGSWADAVHVLDVDAGLVIATELGEVKPVHLHGVGDGNTAEAVLRVDEFDWRGQRFIVGRVR